MWYYMVYGVYIEYTGYAYDDDNECSEEYVYNDIECVYSHMVNVMNIRPENIILYGRSLGSGPSCYLAEKFKVGGYIWVNEG
jgi:hypothetical protein